MSDNGFTPGQKKKGRNLYTGFQSSNVIAFTMLSGSVLTLFSLKLGAGSLFIGILSAMMNLGLLLMIVGRQTIKRLGVKRQWGISWLLRNLSMVPILFAPAASMAGNTTAALLLVLLPFVGFNFFKGIGIVSTNPMLGSLAEGKDRGAFLSRMQIYSHIVLIVTNLFIALFLGPDATVGRYMILLIVGIAAGLFSTVFVFRMPDPVLKTSGADNTLTAAIRRGMQRPEFKFFVTLAALVAFITGLANPFLVVYAKKPTASPITWRWFSW